MSQHTCHAIGCELEVPERLLIGSINAVAAKEGRK